MLYIGEHNNLKIARTTSFGMYLVCEEGDEVLLPTKYILPDFNVGDTVSVFIYKDNNDRPIATTLKPAMVVNEFACLRVRTTESFGAFMEWGIEKDLFVPLAEQSRKMEAGLWYVVYLYVDTKSNRLVGSTKINKFLSNDNVALEKEEAVDLVIFEETNLGFNAIVNRAHKGLIFRSDVYKPIQVGDELTGYVKQVREDGGIDLAIQKIGVQSIAITADEVYNYLKNNNGFLPLTDNSSPEAIMELLHMSKKAFKKSLGVLYRDRVIVLKDDGIYLN
jgi:uncharacterized protein